MLLQSSMILHPSDNKIVLAVVKIQIHLLYNRLKSLFLKPLYKVISLSVQNYTYREEIANSHLSWIQSKHYSIQNNYNKEKHRKIKITNKKLELSEY